MMSGDLRSLPVLGLTVAMMTNMPSCAKHRAVADDHLLYVADGEAVDQPQACGRALFEPHNFAALVLNFEYRAVVGDDDVVLGAAARLGDVGVHAQHVVVAVQRHEEARVYF